MLCALGMLGAQEIKVWEGRGPRDSRNKSRHESPSAQEVRSEQRAGEGREGRKAQEGEETSEVQRGSPSISQSPGLCRKS